MSKQLQDIFSGIIFLIISIVFYIQHDGLNGVSLIFPSVLIGIIFIGGWYFFLHGLILFSKKNIQNKNEEDEIFLWGRVIFIIISATILIFLIELLGFYTSSFLFIFCTFFLFSSTNSIRKKIIHTFFFSICLIGFIWCLFHVILKVPTPTGLFL